MHKKRSAKRFQTADKGRGRHAEGAAEVAREVRLVVEAAAAGHLDDGHLGVGHEHPAGVLQAALEDVDVGRLSEDADEASAELGGAHAERGRQLSDADVPLADLAVDDADDLSAEGVVLG